MAYTQYLGVGFGSAKAGLLGVGYRLFDSSNAAVAARITAGVLNLGRGWFGATITFPDSFVGRVEWDTGEGSPLYLSLFINSLEQRLLALLTPTRMALLDSLASVSVTNPDYVIAVADLPADQAVGYLLTRDAQGELEAGVAVTFQLLTFPSSDSYRTASFNAISNDSGLLQVKLRRGVTYKGRRGALVDWVTFEVPSGVDVFELPQLLGNP